MIRPVFNESNTVLSTNKRFDDRILVYPNPATDLLNISGHFEKLVIYDMFGKRHLSTGYTDQIDPTDRGYLFLRWFLRTRFMKWFCQHWPEKLVVGIGERASKQSRKYR